MPLVLAGAGVPSGKVVAAPVELLDLFPTLAEFAGLEAPGKLDGVSLAPAMRGETTNRRSAASLVFHYDTKMQRDVIARTIIGGDWRYTEWGRDAEERELYVWASDPGEYRNRIGDVSVQSQVTLAQEELTSAGAESWPCQPALRAAARD